MHGTLTEPVTLGQRRKRQLPIRHPDPIIRPYEPPSRDNKPAQHPRIAYKSQAILRLLWRRRRRTTTKKILDRLDDNSLDNSRRKLDPKKDDEVVRDIADGDVTGADGPDGQDVEEGADGEGCGEVDCVGCG